MFNFSDVQVTKQIDSQWHKNMEGYFQSNFFFGREGEKKIIGLEPIKPNADRVCDVFTYILK